MPRSKGKARASNEDLSSSLPAGTMQGKAQASKGVKEEASTLVVKKAAERFNELLTENKALKEQNAALRSQLLTLQESYEGMENEMQQLVKVHQEQEALRKGTDTVTTESSRLKLENAVLEIDNADLRKQLEELKARVTSLEKQVEEMQQMLDALSTIEMVLIRKMVDECRRKCRSIIRGARLQVPGNWNDVSKDPTLVTLLHSQGLSKDALMATGYGWGTFQSQGNRAAHDITEDIKLYAFVTCRMKGTFRKMILDLFEFTFGCHAESIAFE